MLSLKEIAQVQTTLGPHLAYYMRHLLVDLAHYSRRALESSDRICYEETKNPQLSEILEELLQTLETIAGTERDVANKGIKLSIPTFHVMEK